MITSLWARIIQVADSCDAMAMSRPYRAAFSKERVIDEFTRCASTQFDPDIARAMIEILRH